jgi:uncharacterized protein YjiS (DUF1127 family)
MIEAGPSSPSMAQTNSDRDKSPAPFGLRDRRCLSARIGSQRSRIALEALDTHRLHQIGVARQRSSLPFMTLAVTATIGVKDRAGVHFSGAQPLCTRRSKRC